MNSYSPEPEDNSGESLADAGYDAGDLVSIVADDYGEETTVGTVARVLTNQITVTRTDDAIGAVAVHYPRAGYRVSRL